MFLVHLQPKTVMSSKPQLSDMSCCTWSKSPKSKLLNVFAIAPSAAELLGAQIGLVSKCDVLSPTERRSKSRDTDMDTDGDMDSNSTASQPFVRPQWPRSLAPVARPFFPFSSFIFFSFSLPWSQWPRSLASVARPLFPFFSSFFFSFFICSWSQWPRSLAILAFVMFLTLSHAIPSCARQHHVEVGLRWHISSVTGRIWSRSLARGRDQRRATEVLRGSPPPCDFFLSRVYTMLYCMLTCFTWSHNSLVHAHSAWLKTSRICA